MRVVDLDRDMRDVVPTSVSRDSHFLFARMTERTLALTAPAPGRRVLDVASGFGQDARALARGGGFAVALEPSLRMSALARMQDAREGGAAPVHVRAWADGLPFASDSFDAVFCKGALDHFDAPGEAIAEMARVTRREGRVVLAIANFDSLSCRVARLLDGVREAGLGRALPRGRRHYDVPHDHFTRYELGLMREQAAASLRIDHVEGISLGWGLPSWSGLLGRLPEPWAEWLLAGVGAAARRVPALADVVLLVGRPRRISTASA